MARFTLTICVLLAALVAASAASAAPPARDRRVPALQHQVAVLTAAPVAQASTIGQREALLAAKSYLSFGSFSRAGLIKQLTSSYGDGFSRADAVWGVNHAHANWYREAVQAAKAYLRTGSFSRAALIHQLESPYGDHFTHAQAVYGVNVAYR